MSDQQEIVATFDNLNDQEKFIFRFKKDKELGTKRPNVELTVPVPSFEGIVAVLRAGGKGAEMVKEACADVIRSQVASYVAENQDVNQENLPLAQFTWDHIANLDRKDRRSATISEEQWAAFAEDYVTVMSKATTKKAEQLVAATKVYMAKFSMFKTEKKVLNQLKQQLAIYIEATQSEDQFSDILELLVRRLENYLAADDVTALAAAL